MTDSIRDAITWSAEAMRSAVWPRISPMIGGGRLVPVETVTSEGFARELDMLAGIDAWQIIDDHGMRGLASRVQERSDYRTFTIRYSLASGRPTEYHKRVAEIDSKDGRLRPHLICQAYITDRHSPVVLSAAVGRMRDVIEAIRSGYGCERTAPDGNRFKVISWQLLQDIGAPIRVYAREARTP